MVEHIEHFKGLKVSQIRDVIWIDEDILKELDKEGMVEVESAAYDLVLRLVKRENTKLTREGK